VGDEFSPFSQLLHLNHALNSFPSIVSLSYGINDTVIRMTGFNMFNSILNQSKALLNIIEKNNSSTSVLYSSNIIIGGTKESSDEDVISISDCLFYMVISKTYQS